MDNNDQSRVPHELLPSTTSGAKQRSPFGPLLFLLVPLLALIAYAIYGG